MAYMNNIMSVVSYCSIAQGVCIVRMLKGSNQTKQFYILSMEEINEFIIEKSPNLYHKYTDRCVFKQTFKKEMLCS